MADYVSPPLPHVWSLKSADREMCCWFRGGSLNAERDFRSLFQLNMCSYQRLTKAEQSRSAHLFGDFCVSCVSSATHCARLVRWTHFKMCVLVLRTEAMHFLVPDGLWVFFFINWA